LQLTFARHDVSLWMLPATAVVFLVASCGSNSSNPDGGVISCQDDARVATYRPNLTVSSVSRAMSFTLVQANPAPPAVGTNTWTLQVADSSGRVIPNLSLSVDPFMPDHGHGTSVRASVTPNPDGSYTVAPLYFFMPGVWRITFSTTPDAGQTDSAVFFFCVPG
jgi:hypothetical protein